MTISLMFDVIGSDIDHIGRHYEFDGWVNGKLDKDDPNSYFKYELFLAKPVFDWFEENNITEFKVESDQYALRIIFIFNNIEDAVAFKLCWANNRSPMEINL